MPFGTRVLKHNPESQKWPRVWAFCCFYLILGPVLLWEVAGEPVSANNLILDPVGTVTASFRKSHPNVNRNGKQFLSSVGNKLASIRCVFDSCQKIWGSLTLELRAAIASVWLLVVTKVRVNHLLLTTHCLFKSILHKLYLKCRSFSWVFSWPLFLLLRLQRQLLRFNQVQGNFQWIGIFENEKCCN